MTKYFVFEYVEIEAEDGWVLDGSQGYVVTSKAYSTLEAANAEADRLNDLHRCTRYEAGLYAEYRDALV